MNNFFRFLRQFDEMNRQLDRSSFEILKDLEAFRERAIKAGIKNVDKKTIKQLKEELGDE